MTLNEFHHAGGWFFYRLEDGTVRIRIERAHVPDITHNIPPNEWASVVAAVAPNHGSGPEYSAAEALHKGAVSP